MPVPTRASEELLAAPLPDLVRDLGLAVAAANDAMAKVAGPSTVYCIPSAEIEISVAISISKDTTTELGGGFNLNAFSVNASYKSTFGFKEEASSRIRLTLEAKPAPPPPAPPAPPAGGGGGNP